ncbi:hypothetical protein BEWA_027700 [Theileria equi strain WA]|uniref:Uncharacterized protein n=1 Tax=Theileria equi strain WA TaxID=1537102 RepID=L0AY51_THEEQ|nr:hypothetical protein BEWA_027700 [Theileria equi strain WA]AFZ79921.1 hypothetical protein BEWA_027700 [Theileria equi strain WA]|eukprot:XP_004829587.1 hypothetical protein BEWA_027700 [Theileria equi strain WA]
MLSQPQMQMAEDKRDEGLKNAAAFFAGLAIYQLAHFAISAGNFSVVRFQIPRSLVGLYINRFIISYRIATFIGNTTMTIYDISRGPYMTGISIALRWSDAVTYIISLTSFCSGGAQGNLTLHYWVIVAVELINGWSFVATVKIGSKQMPYLLASFPLSGIFASSYHLTFIFFWELFGLSNTFYWLVFYQKVLAIIIATVSAVLWTMAYKGETAEQTGQDAEALNLSGAWSPILMIALGYSLQNMFYPSIAPYKIIGLERGYRIDVTTLITGAIPPLTILVLKHFELSPDRQWKSPHDIWHWVWPLFGLQLTCAFIFILTLHYPDWSLPRTMRTNVFVLALFTISYDLSAQILRVVGSNGASRQTNGSQDNSKVDTFATCFYSFTQIIFAFLGDGYLRVYSKYEKNRENWPTKHCNKKRAFWFWTWSTTKVACKAMKSAFTRDVRAEIQTNKEYLFIVYEDAPPECENHLFDLPFIHKTESSKDYYSLKRAYIFH